MAQNTNRNTTKKPTEVGLKIELSLRKSGYFLFEIECPVFFDTDRNPEVAVSNRKYDLKWLYHHDNFVLCFDFHLILSISDIDFKPEELV